MLGRDGVSSSETRSFASLSSIQEGEPVTLFPGLNLIPGGMNRKERIDRKEHSTGTQGRETQHLVAQPGRRAVAKRRGVR